MSCASLTHGVRAVDVGSAVWAAVPWGHGKVLMKYKALLGWLANHKCDCWRKGQHSAVL